MIGGEWQRQKMCGEKKEARLYAIRARTGFNPTGIVLVALYRNTWQRGDAQGQRLREDVYLSCSHTS